MTTNRRATGWLHASCFVVLSALACAAPAQELEDPPRTDQREPRMAVTSRDGTQIAYDVQGTGPALIMVGGALSGRRGGHDLAQRLAPHFTVYTYDRRGRGDSDAVSIYEVAREINDIEALIDHAGGSAHVYGASSGASLALQAAARLGGKVTKLALYEAPFSDAEGAADEWRRFTAEINALLALGRHEDAIHRFMAFAGVPDEVVARMKVSPAWAGMQAMAPTLAYDLAVLGEDRAVPVDVAAKVGVPTLVMDGSESLGPMPFMRATADTLAKALPKATRRTVDGQAHAVSAEAMAPILVEFFR